ncbi:AsnC family transcriptional regulator [Beijerinckiaceae bacterium]|nr:AsnC family transcriptional regulator [Beijerinckiaceae bacterium]
MKSNALVPEISRFQRRISATTLFPRAKMRRLDSRSASSWRGSNSQGLGRSRRRIVARHIVDEMDRKIMNRLQLDARISNVHLADAVHLSPSACLERVRALERDALIRRYIADFDLAKICSSVMLLVEVVLENHREADFERFLGAIRKRDEVLECYKIGGRIDYLMRVVCRDIDHYNELSDFMSRGELGIEKFHGHVVLALDKTFRGYPLDLLAERQGRE